MLTIVFYATNGTAAKLRAREICAQGKGIYARCYDVAVWEGTEDKCDQVEIMKDVPDWQRARIAAVYGDIEEVAADETAQMEPAGLKPMGNLPPKEEPNADSANDDAEVIPLTAKHRGGGRWFVMRGEEVVSGPHDKAEATRMASSSD